MSGQITVPGNPGEVSDGYHTFDELYAHRIALFCALMAAFPGLSWRSRKHADGEEWDGWFIAGMRLPAGDVTYHLPAKVWESIDHLGIETLERAPEWDGHTSDDVLKRLSDWIEEGVGEPV